MLESKIAIITPILNEQDAIPNVYNELTKIKFNFWICVLNDKTTDRSKSVLEQLSSSDGRIIIIDLGTNNTLAQAYINGIQEGIKQGADKFIELDIGHPVYLIPTFSELLDRYPIVFGTRYGQGQSINVRLGRKIISRLGTFLSRSLLQMPFSDCTSGFQGFTKDVALQLPLKDIMSTGHFYQTEFKFLCRLLPFTEVPFTYVGTKSSLKFSTLIESLRIFFKLIRDNRNISTKSDTVQLPSLKSELLQLIKNDLNQLIGKERFIVSLHLCDTLHQLLIKIDKLIEMEIDRNDNSRIH